MRWRLIVGDLKGMVVVALILVGAYLLTHKACGVGGERVEWTQERVRTMRDSVRAMQDSLQ